jgi:CheY-like chemotaxis protein
MHGFEFVKRLRAEHPNARAVYLSGYSKEDAEQRSESDSDTRILQKPISPQDLARAVREALDR